MEIDQDRCYRALQTRDARFDGHFFTAVRSTGVYCRPICPARIPKRENCLFVACAAAAQEAGYRPCLRCRPEAAPGTPAWHGTSATVSRALRLIADGALDLGSVDALATRLGVGERHLRRLFLTHLGASPLAVAQTQRLLFAKKLLDETDLPMSQVAFASGYSSVRRFNDTIRSAWGRTPRELRRTRRHGPELAHTATSRPSPSAVAPTLLLRLPYRPPFDWRALTDYLAFRAIAGVEVVERDRYVRTIRDGDVRGTVEVVPAPGESHLVARLSLTGTPNLIRVSERLRRVFDLAADPARITAYLAKDPVLRPHVRKRPGLRVPGAWDGFEIGVRAILGQQVSVRGATTLAGRIVELYGEDLAPTTRHRDDADAGSKNAENESKQTPRRLFPRPETLVDLDPAAIGLPAARAKAISALATAVAHEGLDLNTPGRVEESLDVLRALPGIGEWTAQYIAMRALREPDAFPASDLGLRRALGGNGELASPRRVEAASQPWRPWRAYAALHLWSSPAAGPKPAGARARGERPRHRAAKQPTTRRQRT